MVWQGELIGSSWTSIYARVSAGGVARAGTLAKDVRESVGVTTRGGDNAAIDREIHHSDNISAPSFTTRIYLYRLPRKQREGELGIAVRQSHMALRPHRVANEFGGPRCVGLPLEQLLVV